jgi:hypothetical protein
MSIKHVVTLTVTNGPFKTAYAARQAAEGVKRNNKAITATSPIKTRSGYTFKFSIRYGARTAAAKTALVSKLKQLGKSSGVASNKVSIKTRTL